MTETSAPLDDGHLDLSNHDSFWNGVPHKTFDRLRLEDPCIGHRSMTVGAGSGR